MYIVYNTHLVSFISNYVSPHSFVSSCTVRENCSSGIQVPFGILRSRWNPKSTLDSPTHHTIITLMISCATVDLLILPLRLDELYCENVAESVWTGQSVRLGKMTSMTR